MITNKKGIVALIQLSENAKKIFHNFNLGPKSSEDMRQQPEKIVDMLSHYKFASKLIGADKKVLDMQCKEGLGTWLIAMECGKAVGIDCDEANINISKSSFNDPRVSFIHGNPISNHKINMEKYDAIIRLGIEKSADLKEMPTVIQWITAHLHLNGIVVWGFPNTMDANIMNISDDIHLMFSNFFKHVFVFSAINSSIFAGSLSYADHFMLVACSIKTGENKQCNMHLIQKQK